MKRMMHFSMMIIVAVALFSQAVYAEGTETMSTDTAPKKREVFSLSNHQHSLSIDVIRIMDEAQWEGLMNLYYQISLNKRSALVVGLSHGHDVTLFEGAYKYYLEKYFDGPFAQVGGVIGDFDGDNDAGITGALGYEKGLTRHLVASGAVEMTVGSMDHPVTGDNDPIFRAILGLTFAF